MNEALEILLRTGRRGPNLRTETVSNAQAHTALNWPKGVVTYYLDNNSYDYIISQRVRMAMNKLETVSCVRFKPVLVKPSGNLTWIHFTNPQGKRDCVHEPVFKQDGEIMLVIGLDCLKEHEILHTLLHAIGFKDEVTHPQRNQYIRVMWDNIQAEYRHLYRIQSSNDKTSELLVEYDPLSIMHFHDRAFSMNGQATVTPLVPGLLISPSDDLSQLDKMRLRLLFDHECNKRKVGDMIDTCKMVLSDKRSEHYQAMSNAIQSNSNDEDNNNSGEANNVDEPVEKEIVDTTDEPDENEMVDTTDEPDENEMIDTINDADKVDEVGNGNKTDEKQEVDEENIQLNLKSIENQYDLNERHPDTILNRVLPQKLLNQLEDSEDKEKTDDETAEKQDHSNENQRDSPESKSESK